MKNNYSGLPIYFRCCSVFFSVILLVNLTSPLLSQSLKFHKKAQLLIGTFSIHHPKPIQINETTSAEIVELFIDNLDARGLILKKDDVTALKKNGTQLLSQINLDDDDYITSAQVIYTKSLHNLDSILDVLAKKNINFSEKDSITFLKSNDKTYYSENNTSYSKRIEKYIKSKSFKKLIGTNNYSQLLESEVNAKLAEYSKDFVLKLKRSINEYTTNSTKTVESVMLNAIALRHDPNSNYFTFQQNKEFNKQLSASIESFGIDFDEDENGITSVISISPGGAAWMSNQINEGDIFISIRIGNTLFTNEDIDAQQLQNKIEYTNEKKITLLLKKKNGVTKTVKLVKLKVASEENTVKGYIIYANGINLGYISLPSFYTNSFDDILPGCANDVAKEIIKLEKDSIKGLIIDLRNNGGGSMLEAINLAGIFVDEGPLFIYKENKRKPTLIKDVNRGSIFKNQIIVLINENSASASELFSNIVKDYNIGIVVGQSSHGKATAQFVTPLDTNLRHYKARKNENTDFLKITHAKFYRLDCSTHQGIGVVPEISFPASPGQSLFTENKQAYYLKPDSIVKKVVYSSNPPIAILPIKEASEKRINTSTDFKRYREVADSVDTFILSEQKIALNFKSYVENEKKTEKLFSSFEEASAGKNNIILARNNTFDAALYEANSEIKEFNNKVLEQLVKDLLLNETFLIFNDLINQQEKK